MDRFNYLSPKMQTLCLEILNIAQNKNISTNRELQSCLKDFYQYPMVTYASSILMTLGLTKYDIETFSIKPTFPNASALWKAVLRTKGIASEKLFETHNDCIEETRYVMPNEGKITFRELTLKDYLSKKEFYDYEFASLFVSNQLYDRYFMNTKYVENQFKKVLRDKTGEKRLHIYVAEMGESVVGFLSASNYTNSQDDFFFFDLPSKPHKIFNINLVQTRDSLKRKKIASVLLGQAINDIFYLDDAYALAYHPIIEASRELMTKIVDPKKYNIHKRSWTSEEDIRKYGTLKGYIITKKEQRESEAE